MITKFKNEPKPKTITLSYVEKMKEAGFEIWEHGDASKANSDYFLIMVRKEDGRERVQIICPTFLRGGLGFDMSGGISY